MSRKEGARTLALVFIASVVGSFAGGVIISWLADNPKIFGGPWWEVMTALGTVGAVCVALGVAGWQYFANRKEKLVSSVCAAAAIYQPASMLGDEITKIGNRLLGGWYLGKNVDPSHFIDLKKEVLNARDQYDIRSPERLVPISPKIAAQLSSALSSFNVIACELDNISKKCGRTWKTHLADVTAVGEVAIHTGRLLESVAKECGKVALPLGISFQTEPGQEGLA